jgi:hypothetical protein
MLILDIADEGRGEENARRHGQDRNSCAKYRQW